MTLEVRCSHRFDSGFGVDFAFESAHRTTALFGPSGAGKTSLLMMIAGFVHPDAGRIACGGRVLLDTEAGVALPPEARRLGVVFQDQRLFPHLSVEANLRFGRHPSGRRGSGGPAAAPSWERILEVLELGGLATRSPDTLSGGERQRVALGRALMSAPELLLLDEPVAAVDEPHRQTILRYVDRVVDEWEVPMVYVSHHRSEVQRLAEWVVAIDGGMVSEQGPPEQVLGADALLAAGEPVNLLRIDDLAADDDGAWLGRLGAGIPIRLQAAPADAPTRAPLFVQFAASDVMLASGETAGLSARNRLPGRVTDIVPRSGRFFVALQVGEQRLWAEVTAAAIDDLALVPGTAVTCLIKSAALKIID